MTALRDIIAQNPSLYLSVGGLLIGFVFGAIVYRTNFCTMGSISDFMSFGDFRRFRAWMLAAAVALLATQALQWAGVVELKKSMYLTPTLNWAGNILGGLMFGFGMVFAGGCASKNLARVGGGDLRSLMVLLVIGLFAFMAIGGVLGPARAFLDSSLSVSLAPLKASSQGLDGILAGLSGLPLTTANLIATGFVGGLLLVYCFADGSFRGSPNHILSGLGVGLCVAAGWALTGLAFDELSDKPMAPISLTYVRPTGDTLDWLERYTALGWPGFGVATVFGAVLGAFVAAKAMGRFQLTTFSDKGDTVRSLMGAALMGIGGVMALGCTVGQAVTGISTLALGSFLTTAGIVIGGIYGMKVFEHMLMSEV